jgi:hypothetical protein
MDACPRGAPIDHHSFIPAALSGARLEMLLEEIKPDPICVLVPRDMIPGLDIQE